jgi:hypothetical protein
LEETYDFPEGDDLAFLRGGILKKLPEIVKNGGEEEGGNMVEGTFLGGCGKVNK